MRYSRKSETPGVRGAGLQSETQNRQTENEYSKLATGACTCGGPGGRPGMHPVCRTCLATDRYMRAAEFSCLIGWNRTGFSPC